MSSFYCPYCTDLLGLRPPIPADPLATTYQQDKHDKHTQAPHASSERVRTVFDSTSTQYYVQCIQEAVRRGAVEITKRGDTNVIFCPSTGSTVGSKRLWGQLVDRQDSVLVVLTSDQHKVHGMLEASSSYSNRRCSNCGSAII